MGKGLPPEWEALLRSSGLSIDEVRASPTTVMNVLSFQQAWRESTALGIFWEFVTVTLFQDQFHWWKNQ